MVLGAGAHNMGIWSKIHQWKYMKTTKNHHNRPVRVWIRSEWLAHKHDKAHTRVIVDRQLWAQRQHRESPIQWDIQSNIRESVLVYEDIVVGRATGTENSPVAQQIKIKFDRINHVAVDNSASDAIPAFWVTFTWSTWEKPNVVPLADYDKSNGGFEFQLSTCTYVDVSC
jgi:hypothetical protein